MCACILLQWMAYIVRYVRLKNGKIFKRGGGEDMENHICLICGNKFKSGKTEVYLCEKCQGKIKLIKKVEMVDKAKKELEKRKGKMKAYRPKLDMSKYANAVKERVINGVDNFSSIPETVVAIQMERIGLKYQSQKNIAGKRVDFSIPEIKIILEIDGELYHEDENASFIRDRHIMAEVGEEWEIVHIRTDEVPFYTWNLKEALPFIVSERNESNSFRNSRLDDYFLEKFKEMELYLKRIKRQ